MGSIPPCYAIKFVLDSLTFILNCPNAVDTLFSHRMEKDPPNWGVHLFSHVWDGWSESTWWEVWFWAKIILSIKSRQRNGEVSATEVTCSSTFGLGFNCRVIFRVFKGYRNRWHTVSIPGSDSWMMLVFIYWNGLGTQWRKEVNWNSMEKMNGKNSLCSPWLISLMVKIHILPFWKWKTKGKNERKKIKIIPSSKRKLKEERSSIRLYRNRWKLDPESDSDPFCPDANK